MLNLIIYPCIILTPYEKFLDFPKSFLSEDSRQQIFQAQ